MSVEGDTQPDVIETSAFTVWVGEDGIVRTVVKPEAEIVLADAKERVAAMVRCAGGRKVPVLADIRRIKKASRAARRYMIGSEATKGAAAVGILVGSPVSRAIATFFISISPPPYPARVFTSESQALDWLRTLTE